MDLKDKIVGLSLAAAIGLIGWNLNETTKMRTKHQKQCGKKNKKNKKKIKKK